MMDSGSPTLVMPYAGIFTTLGKRILAAWKGSREAARAVHDAMPFLQRAELVSVLGINPRQADHIAGFDIPNRIALHCGNAVAARIVSGDLSAGVLLLFEAADLGADMIVMGAYGQLHLREFILAGT